MVLEFLYQLEYDIGSNQHKPSMYDHDMYILKFCQP